MTDRYRQGAFPEADAARFRVWAPEAAAVELVLERPVGGTAVHAMTRDADGFHSVRVPGAGVGDRYRYRIDGAGPFPDPASRFQPEGVHGPSEVVDPSRFPRPPAGWSGIAPADAVIYELHVGTFSPEGTYEGVVRRLPHLAELGVTAIEIMPVADFPGRRNWGYDGVAPCAPARCYGRPEDLARLVDAAHRAGLAVLLDVVYNHLGPDGNHLGAFSPFYFSDRHSTPWGACVNLDGEHSGPVREYFLAKAVQWIADYGFDGLRLDATHALIDDGPRHFLAELSDRVRAAAPGRRVLLIAEDHRNDVKLCRPTAEGGYGLDGVWADDLHHQVRRLLAGDSEGYYADFTGTTADLAGTLSQGWFYCGQRSESAGHDRGTDPAPLDYPAFCVCIQNHDQIGNRAMGERLNHQIDPAAWRAASALLLFAPETPLLFQGQEWAAGTPFRFFTDHKPELGRLVTEGRRREFKHFSAFADPEARERIPDPQAEATFASSRLDWAEPMREPHSGCLRLYQALLRLRRTEPALRSGRRGDFQAVAADADTVILLRRNGDAPPVAAVIRLRGAGKTGRITAGTWRTLLTTEDAAFAPDPAPPTVDAAGGAVRFARPGAVLLRAE